METPEEVRRRVRREKQLASRLQLATTRLETAQQERIWAIAAAYAAGLSIRKIAAATGLSPSRVHQLLSNEEAREIPGWLSPLREQGLASEEDPLVYRHSFLSTLQICLAEEVEVLRWCLEWLERLDRGEDVVVNLRPDTDTETEFVRFDRARVLRVLARIVADLDELAGKPLAAVEDQAQADEAARARHRRRLAEPEHPPKPLTQREQRAVLRKAFGLPPYGSDPV
jgi:transcriptional regulator with XRE-family HTH domain